MNLAVRFCAVLRVLDVDVPLLMNPVPGDGAVAGRAESRRKGDEAGRPTAAAWLLAALQLDARVVHEPEVTGAHEVVALAVEAGVVRVSRRGAHARRHVDAAPAVHAVEAGPVALVSAAVTLLVRDLRQRRRVGASRVHVERAFRQRLRLRYVVAGLQRSGVDELRTFGNLEAPSVADRGDAVGLPHRLAVLAGGGADRPEDHQDDDGDHAAHHQPAEPRALLPAAHARRLAPPIHRGAHGLLVADHEPHQPSELGRV